MNIFLMSINKIYIIFLMNMNMKISLLESYSRALFPAPRSIAHVGWRGDPGSNRNSLRKETPCHPLHAEPTATSEQPMRYLPTRTTLHGKFTLNQEIQQ
jgi:hypothetical protein